MSRYIDADKLIEELNRFTVSTDDFYGAEYSDALTAVEDTINDMAVSEPDYRKFYDYFGDLYGKGLGVSGWLLSGNLEDFDNFFDDAEKYMVQNMEDKNANH